MFLFLKIVQGLTGIKMRPLQKSQICKSMVNQKTGVTAFLAYIQLQQYSTQTIITKAHFQQ